MDYEKELLNLKNAQKDAAVADLQKTRDTSLSNLAAEEAKIQPAYAAQRNTANVQNRVAARNFQEYLANTGRANSGIGAQYEMSRQNSLNNNLNALRTAETQDMADIARRRTDANNAYQTGLAGANATVEANYINNLLAQRQAQWEREFQQKQFDEQVRQYNQNRADSLARLYSTGSSGGSSRTSTSKSKTTSNSAYANLDKQLSTLNTQPKASNNVFVNGALAGATAGANALAKTKLADAYNKGQINQDQFLQLAQKYKF